MFLFFFAHKLQIVYSTLLQIIIQSVQYALLCMERLFFHFLDKVFFNHNVLKMSFLYIRQYTQDNV